jgi:hypothetical protein
LFISEREVLYISTHSIGKGKLSDIPTGNSYFRNQKCLKFFLFDSKRWEGEIRLNPPPPPPPPNIMGLGWCEVGGGVSEGGGWVRHPFIYKNLISSDVFVFVLTI